MMAKQLASTEEAAADAGVSELILLGWVHQGLVKPAKRTLAGHYRWDLDDLRRQLIEHWPDDYGGELGGRGPLA